MYVFIQSRHLALLTHAPINVPSQFQIKVSSQIYIYIYVLLLHVNALYLSNVKLIRGPGYKCVLVVGSSTSAVDVVLTRTVLG